MRRVIGRVARPRPTLYPANPPREPALWGNFGVVFLVNQSPAVRDDLQFIHHLAKLLSPFRQPIGHFLAVVGAAPAVGLGTDSIQGKSSRLERRPISWDRLGDLTDRIMPP